MLVSPNNEMAAMLVSRSNPPGIEGYSHGYKTKFSHIDGWDIFLAMVLRARSSAIRSFGLG